MNTHYVYFIQCSAANCDIWWKIGYSSGVSALKRCKAAQTWIPKLRVVYCSEFMTEKEAQIKEKRLHGMFQDSKIPGRHKELFWHSKKISDYLDKVCSRHDLTRHDLTGRDETRHDYFMIKPLKVKKEKELELNMSSIELLFSNKL